MKKILERTETEKPVSLEEKTQSLTFRANHYDDLKKFAEGTGQNMTDITNKSIELFLTLARASDSGKSKAFLDMSCAEEKLRLKPWTLYHLAQATIARLIKEPPESMEEKKGEESKLMEEESLLESLASYIEEEEPKSSIPGVIARVLREYLKKNRKGKKGR